MFFTTPDPPSYTQVFPVVQEVAAVTTTVHDPEGASHIASVLELGDVAESRGAVRNVWLWPEWLATAEGQNAAVRVDSFSSLSCKSPSIRQGYLPGSVDRPPGLSIGSCVAGEDRSLRTSHRSGRLEKIRRDCRMLVRCTRGVQPETPWSKLRVDHFATPWCRRQATTSKWDRGHVAVLRANGMAVLGTMISSSGSCGSVSPL